MTVTPSSPIVGIFRDRSMAEQAINALYGAGFTSEQVRYSVPGTSGSILADLKSLFTGQNASGGNIANDLTDMGLSSEEAQYYSNEYKNGNTILAVSASSREQEALNMLHQYGAYNARTSDSSPDTVYSQQPSDANQQAVYTPDATQQTAYTPDETSSQQDSTSTWAAQQQPSDIEDHPFQNAQQTSTRDTAAPNYQPGEASITQSPEYQSDEASTTQSPEYQPALDYRSTSQDTSSHDAGTLEATPDSQVTPSDAVISDSTSAAQTTPSELTNTDAAPAYQATSSDQTVTDPTTEPQRNQTDATASDQTVTDSTPTSQDMPLTTTAPSEYGDEFQQLQAQLQAAQQQLQDARTQLQAAKEHEAQIQTIQERERQLQAARQQLQDIQAQLQATLAELHETHQRISQYQ